MLPLSVGLEAGPGVGAPPCLCRRPERTCFYQIVEEYCLVFMEHLETPGAYVEQEFEEYLKCSSLERRLCVTLAIAAMWNTWRRSAADAAGNR